MSRDTKSISASAPRPVTAAFFDMDRTLLRVNSGSRYVRWRLRTGKLGVLDFLRVSWWLLKYTLGVLDAERVSRLAVTRLAGKNEAAYRSECRAWVEREIVPHISDAARRELAGRRATGHLCAILTTSSPYVAEPVARALGIEHVLCSKMTVVNGFFTGELDPPLCYGRGKVQIAQRWAEQHGVDLGRSVFFTDSVSDLPMLEEVGEARVINPDPRLERLARRRGWSIAQWS